MQYVLKAMPRMHGDRHVSRSSEVREHPTEIMYGKTALFDRTSKLNTVLLNNNSCGGDMNVYILSITEKCKKKHYVN